MPPIHQPTRALPGLVLAWGLLPASFAAGPPDRQPGEPFLLRPAAEVPNVRAASLSPFQPVGVTSRLRRATLQFEALTADEAWDEAIDLLLQLETEAGDELVADDEAPALNHLVADAKDHQRYTPLAKRLQAMLASLPEAGLEAYRDRYERSAQERVNEAIQSLDEPALAKVVCESQPTRAAAEASLALAELALERGDAASARRWLTPLERLANGPYGRPAGASLGLLDPSVDPDELAEAWTDTLRPGTPLVGDGEDLAATVLARLAHASLSEGDLRRAAMETRLLRGVAPEATGRFAGREQPLATALEALIASQSTPESPPRPSPDYRWAWSEPTTFQPPPAPTNRLFNGGVRIGFNAAGQRQLFRIPEPDSTKTDQPPSVNAVASDRSAFYVEQSVIKRLDLLTGETEAFTLPGIETTPPPQEPGPALNDLTTQRIQLGGLQGQFVQFNGGRPTPAISPTRIDPQLAYSGGLLFARVVQTPNAGRARRGVTRIVRETLLGVDPDEPSEAAVRIVLSQEVEPQGMTRWEFGGPPTVRGDRLYVPLVRPGVRSDLAVACYSIHSSRELWRTELGAGEPRNRVNSTGSASVTVAGDAVYVATELGAVAALRADDGAKRWLAVYPRDAATGFNGQIKASGLRPPPRRLHLVGDRVIGAPSDSRRLLAWDTATGRPLWDAPRDEQDRLVGVVDDPNGSIAVLAGRRLLGFDSLTGGRRFAWPESERAGLRGRGVAAIADGEVFWPTRTELIAFDPVRGGISRPPIGLHPVGAAGANLLTTDLGLLVAGPKKIRLLASTEPIKAEPVASKQRLSHEKFSPENSLAAQP